MTSFNPRAREGRDNVDRHLFGLVGVSIHAPVKGATVAAARPRHGQHVSIHAPVKGATASAPIKWRASVFQSTRP